MARPEFQGALQMLLGILAIFSFAEGARAQEATPAWHGHHVQPGSTAPQCIAESSANEVGFEDCSLWAGQFPQSWLQAQTFHIWTPEGYKEPRVGAEFWTLFGASLASTIFDEEETQRLLREKLDCNAAGQCFRYREEDPLLGQTRYQAYGIFGAISAVDYFACRRARQAELLRTQVGLPKYHTRFWSTASNWRLPLLIQTAAHLAEGIKASHEIQ